MHKNKNFDFCCQVCGLNQGFKPWGDQGDLPTFDICGCCGVQFGYEDCTLEGIKEFREKWLREGGNWFSFKEKPQNWSLKEQMKNIPFE